VLDIAARSDVVEWCLARHGDGDAVGNRAAPVGMRGLPKSTSTGCGTKGDGYYSRGKVRHRRGATPEVAGHGVLKGSQVQDETR
jgi:hypothetical protein